MADDRMADAAGAIRCGGVRWRSESRCRWRPAAVQQAALCLWMTWSSNGSGAWWTFCAGSFTCFLTGFTYTFGEWSPVVKSSFRYSQAPRFVAADVFGRLL
eukprot:g18392.t1